MAVDHLTHVDESGKAHMVDVGGKPATERVAVARGEVHLQVKTLELINQGLMKKGDVLTVAQQQFFYLSYQEITNRPLLERYRTDFVRAGAALDEADQEGSPD